MAGGDPQQLAHAAALGRAEQLVRDAEAAAARQDGAEAVRKAWAAVKDLKEARAASPRNQDKRGERSPLYVRLAEAVKRAGQWAEAHKIAAHLRFDRDARPEERARLAEVVQQADEALKLAGPPEECNLVVKGGITSGVLYPRAISALSDRYTFRQIGGASVGAVAAAATAAAEYCRQHFSTQATNQGFEGLEKTAEELGATDSQTGRSKLLGLFQPQPETKPAMDVLLAVLGAQTTAGKVLAALAAMLKAQPLPALAGLLVGALLVALAWGKDQALLVTVAVLAAFAAVATGIAISVGTLGMRLYQALSANRYGLCAGHGPRERTEGLTAWMMNLFNRLAGLPDNAPPITFGDLWGDDPDHPKIELVVTTSNLTFGHPYRVPFLKEYEAIPTSGAPFIPKRFFFKVSDFEELFPEDVGFQMGHGGQKVLDALLASPVLDARWRKALPVLRDDGYLPFPDGKDLPVVVAVRMSLSYPLLVSAVPLYAVDEWQTEEDLRLERVWFSDGGECSNLPIHFFDTLIPSRPTFAINLLKREDVDPDDQAKNVWMPSNNLQGLSERWNRFEGRGLLGFLGAVIDTMMSWNDSMQMSAPGYRDRIVHIFHTQQEGGLNLTMPQRLIQLMSLRGEKAGERVLTDFDWDNHLWVRLRSVLDISDTQLAFLRDGPLKDPAARALFARLLDEHTGAQIPEDNAPVTQAQAAELPALLHLFEELVGAKQQSYCDQAAPDPTPELRVRPKV